MRDLFISTLSDVWTLIYCCIYLFVFTVSVTIYYQLDRSEHNATKP